MRPAKHTQHGFTFLEIAIAITVIGLIVAGITVGMSLMRGAELRSAISDGSRFRAAVFAFKEKYFYLPGDMPNAVSYWGAQAGGTSDGVDSTCAHLTTEASGTLTCNGNGDGWIAGDVLPIVGPPLWPERLQYYEGYRAWQHLTNAGLIPGKYWGNSQSSAITVYSAPGVNVPKSKLANKAGWSFRAMSANYDSWGPWFYIPATNYLLLADFTVGNSADPVLRPIEAQSIDEKLDDGKPGLGLVVGLPRNDTPGGYPSNCTVDGAADTNYKVTDDSIACQLMLQLR